MSNNIRDFRNAGSANTSAEGEKSNTGFYAMVIAIPVIAALAGVGYKPLMELRGKNVAAVAQAEADMEAKRRAENPMYALLNQPTNADGLIDSSKPLSFGKPVSPDVAAARKAVRDYARRSLTAKEFLGRVDAKAAGFNPLEMELLKHKRASWALKTCSHSDLSKFYLSQNKAAYDVLKAKQDAIRDARSDAYQANAEKLEIPKIENKTQAIAFVATGGAAKHQQNSMAMMAGMADVLGSSSNNKISSRRQRFNKTGCMQVRTIIQSGKMRIKPNVRLK